MRIFVKSPGEKTIRLRFPTCLIFNSLTAPIGFKIIKKYVDFDVNISAHDSRRLIKEISRMKRKYPDLCLVEVESGRDIVKINL